MFKKLEMRLFIGIKCDIVIYMKDRIIGHNEVISFFDKVISAGNLGHAYCFVGPSMVGKKRVAMEISADLLGTKFDKLSRQPDFLIIEQEKNKKTGKTKKNIDIDQIRSLRNFVRGRPFVAKYKAVIVDDAQKMNLASVNGLLKTLEEPSEHTVIFLITEDETTLPETILSRCQMIYFYPVSSGVLVDAVGSEYLELVNESLGLPGLLKKWIEEPEVYSDYKLEVKRFLSLIGEPFYKKMSIVEVLFGDKVDHIAARSNLLGVLSIWQEQLRSFMPFGDGVKRDEISLGDLLKVYDSIIEAKGKLTKNIHPRLLVENILLLIP